jgi:hypothetical protein
MLVAVSGMILDEKILAKCSEAAIIFGFPVSFLDLAEICSPQTLEHY